uniref:Phytocyanin domain-containing protein n=1 Tax=Opuntia streptacantha TaxID=393608 RepID=A0A7C8ZY41_OPUST
MGCQGKVRAGLNWLVVVVVAVVWQGGKWGVEGQVHHVVGDDRGWDLTSADIAAWAATRTFAVGDFIWFAYSGGIGQDRVVELKSKEEFESCDLRNPIRMYTDGLDKIPLEEEGIRYFASSNIESCKKGLKLPVDVKSKSRAENEESISIATSEEAALSLAQEPTAPSSSTKICGSIMIIIGGLMLSHVGV